MLEVRLIGKFDIRLSDKPVTISSRIAQSLFAYLILNAGTSYRREKLAGMFWPDAPEEKARAYLRHELWRIRKALSSRSRAYYLLADDINICFNPSVAYWLDVIALRSAGEACSIDELISALHVYQGELLPGFYDDWVTLEREHLQTLYEQRMAVLLELLENERRWQDILEWAERWIALGHKPESAYRALMVAYDALGDRPKVTSTYERYLGALRELDLDPSEEIRTLAFKQTRSLNIPIPLTSFIGRENELREVADLLSKTRLVTLTGAGGVGKTRLAIQVAADVLERFPDGVWFLDLAPLSDPALIPNTLANLLRLRELGKAQRSSTDLLINYLNSRTALVIFDNCEHLIEAAAQLVHALLISCERLSILATSREGLRVSGERTYRVPSLETPKVNVEADARTIGKFEAVRLFTERAATDTPGFALSPQNAWTIARICQRLDGIPLAIELAAARTNVLTVEQILNRLDDRFNLLTAGMRTALPRHQTLRATIEWSYGLLTEEECIFFRRLAVFTGGWTLEAAEKICSGKGIQSEEILELLSQLVNKSLVVVETREGEARYRSLEIIREFAREKLIEAAEAGSLQDRHMEYFLNLAESAEPHLTGPEQLEWLPLLDADYKNLRLALEWSLSKKSPESSQRMCTALGWFWEIRCYWLEGLSWLTKALAKAAQDANKEEKVARARALYTRAMLEHQLGHHFEQILFPAEESLALAMEVSGKRDIAIARFFLGLALVQQGDDYDRASSFMEQSFIEFQELEDLFWQAYSFPRFGSSLAMHARLTYLDVGLRSLGLARKAAERLTLADTLTGYADLLVRVGRVDEGWKYAAESERCYKAIGSEKGSINSLLFAEIAWINGETGKAKSLYEEMYERFSLLGEKGYISNCIERLSILAMEDGDLDRARAYLEEGILFERDAGWKPFIAIYLTELANISYLQGNLDEFKQNFRESLALREYLNPSHKVFVLMTVIGSLYIQQPDSSARLLGIIIQHEGPFTYPRTPLERRYCQRAETHARKFLGGALFESAFAEGQKMSLDEGLELALKRVVEM